MIALLSEEELAKYPTLILPEQYRGNAGHAASCHHCSAMGDPFRPDPQFSGNLQVDPEIHLPSPGMDIDVAYFYNGTSTQNGPYGYGRTLSPNLTAQACPTPSRVTLARANGAIVTYQETGSGTNVFNAGTPGLLNSFVKDTTNSYWKETTPDGHLTAYPLDTTGKLSSLTYAQDSVGNIHSYSYSSGLLQTIQDSVGRFVSFGYSSGLLQSIQDWAGRRTTFQYDTASASPKSLLTTVTGPTGCQTGYQYSTFALQGGTSDWLLSGIVDPNGYGTSYSYDQQKRVISRAVAGVGLTTYLYQPTTMLYIDSSGAVSTHTLDSLYSLVGSVDAMGGQSTLTRNANRQETMRQNALGFMTTSTYDGIGNLSSVMNPLGFVITTAFDAYRNLTTMQYADGSIVSNIYGYAGSGYDTTGSKRRLQASVDQLGSRMSYTYNSRGQMASVQNALGFLTTYGYDNFGNLVSIQDALGNTATQVFDLAGNAIATVNPLGSRWSATFDNMNRVTSKTDPLGNISSVGYDSIGNMTVQINPLGYRTSTTFNVFDKPVAVQNALGNIFTTVYDSLGRSIASVDPLGNRNTAVFDSIGRQVGSINPLGFRSTTIFDINGQAVASQNALGYYSTMVYDQAGQPIANVNALGYRSTTVFDGNGRVVASVNALGYRTSIVFDLAGQKIARVDALGSRWSATFDAARRMVAEINPLGYSSTTVYDAVNRAVASVDTLGNRSTQIFDIAGQEVAYLNPLGFYATTVYDVAARAVASVDALGYITSALFDAADQVIASQDALGYLSTNIFDAIGRQIASQDALGRLITTVFEAANRAIASVNALGLRNTINFDTANRLMNSVDPLDRIYTVILDAANQMIATVSPLGYRASYVRDAIGRGVATQDARGNVTSNVFDKTNRSIAFVSALGYRTSTVYDATGRRIASQDALGFLHTSVFNVGGQAIASINPLNFRSTSVFSATGQTLAILDSLGSRTSAIFDAIGQHIASQSALGYLSSTIFDPMGRSVALVDSNSHRITSLFSGRGDLLSTQDALGALTSWQYDPVGNTILRTDARSWPTSYTVDALNRTIGQEYIDGTRVTNTFDQAGQQLTSQDLLGIRSFGYDLDGRQTNVAFPTGLILSMGFDPVSNRVSLLDPDNGLTSWSYDAQNRIVGIVNPLAEYTTIQWDALDREQHKILANGMAVSHTFDSAGRETLLENRKADGTGLAIFTNTYDPISNRLTVAEMDGTLCTFGYDRSYQLTLEQRSGANSYNTSYVYDPVGNRLVKYDSGLATNYQVNAANELILSTPPSGQPTTNTYDTNGNLSLQNIGDALTTYSWDPENRLLSVSDNTGVESYAYSADGLRQKKVNGAGATNFVWDDQNLFQERDASLLKIAQYSDFPGYWGGLVSQRRSTTSSFHAFDSQRRSRILVNTGGNITDNYSFKGFGEELAAGSGTVNPHRYVGLFGYYRDIATRLQVRARELDVTTGRWISRDPIGFDGGDWNLYRYVANLPIDKIDPNGKQPRPPYCPVDGTCPPNVPMLMIRWCQRFRSPWLGSVRQAVNNCLRRGAARDHQNCGSLTPNRTNCLRQFCRGAGQVKCRTCTSTVQFPQGSSCGTDPSTACGCTPKFSEPGGDFSNPVGGIILCSNNISKPACGNHFDLGWLDSTESVILHEMMHACGIGHINTDLRKNCNDLWACCIHNVIGRNGDGNECWSQPRFLD